MFPLFLFIVWFLWAIGAVLEKKAKGGPGGVSVVPVFPLFPLLAWGLAVALDLAHDRLGYYIVGALHLILLVLFLGGSLKYLYVIVRNQ
jgi:hypothetical protein